MEIVAILLILLFGLMAFILGMGFAKIQNVDMLLDRTDDNLRRFIKTHRD